MVDYDKAVATVQDPNADPVLLAKIAYETRIRRQCGSEPALLSGIEALAGNVRR